MGVSMTCFILIIGLAKIVYIRSQTVTITAAPNPVTSGDKLKLTCGYNGSETESGVKWFQIGDLEGVIYIEDIANRTNCTYVFGGNAYNLSLFSTTCDAVQNVYTLSFTVLPSDINKSWCCTYLVSTNIDCVQSILIMEATTTTSSSTPESTNGIILDALCKPDGALFIILDICIIISYIIMVILIIVLIIWNKNSTISIFKPCVKTGHRCLRILYLVLLIIVVVCEIGIVIIIIIGRQCQIILGVGLGLGLFIITVTCIVLIVFIKTADTGKRSMNTRPPAIHIGTQNKVEPKTTSKQTNERSQPFPPVGGVVEDKLKRRPQPPPPENIDAKDRNLQGLPPNYEDAQGLPIGTPPSNRLTPLTPKQATVQEEDASKGTKKKRKKKKKKGQMNVEQEEGMEELRRTLPEDEADED